MSNIQKIAIFLNYFGMGLFIPILSLFFLAHGCNLNSLAVIMGIYALTVIVAEIPSGMYADIKGRKASFYLSSAFTCSSFILMYFASNINLLGVGVILFGLGKAFVSGSLDSLMLENCLRLHGKEELSKYVSTNLIFQSIGIALGSLIGGFIPNINGYFFHFVLRELFLLITCFLIMRFIEEPSQSQTANTKELLTNTKLLLKKNNTLHILMVCMLASMVAIFSLETYWQPEIKTMLSEGQYYLLGIMSACGYGATILGSMLGGFIKMNSQKIRWIYYLFFSTFPALILFFLAIQYSKLGFILCYIGFMLTLGLISVPEQTLLNSMLTNEARASVLSLSSFFSQLGGVIISCISASFVMKIGIRGIWTIASLLTFVVIVVASVPLLIKNVSIQRKKLHKEEY